MLDIEKNLGLEDLVLFTNPLSEDYSFKWDSKPILVRAKQTVPMVYFKARHGMKHLVDYIILHKKAKEVWAELKLDREDLDEIANKETNAVLKAGRNLNNGREEIEKLILSLPEGTASTSMPTDAIEPIKIEEKEEEFAGI